MSPAFPSISRAELFARFAEGHAAGITVVTPNRRLAQVLKAEFDRGQAGKGFGVWEDADILPFASFATRCYEEALYADRGDALPLLLADSQAHELWEETIRTSRWGDELLDVPQTAVRAAEAWRLAHAWRIPEALDKFEGTEDAKAFAEWARAYAKRCHAEACMDAAVLPDALAGRIAKKPRLLVAYAFDILTPQAAAFLTAAGGEVHACAPEARPAAIGRASFASPDEELDAAARWARGRLEAGASRIGVVVPDLQLRRKAVVRVFSRVVRPDFNLPGTPRAAMPFNVSLGEPLAQVPLVAFALALLEFAVRDAEFETVSRLIRSPFFGGAQSAMEARARLDAQLRRRAGATLSLRKLITLLEDGSSLRELLAAVVALEPADRTPHGWARHFTAVLAAAGFPGERTLDSVEFQARARFHALLGEFARLGGVAPEFSARDAVLRLRRLCVETLFQPEAPDAPVQVLGLLESAGLEFDALWVSGLTDEAWPLSVRPHPFLPVALQRKAGIPEASAETSLALDRRFTQGWAGAAREVVFSWPHKDGERELGASTLIAQYPERQVAIADYPCYRDAIFAHRGVAERTDETAPAVSGKEVRGGTGVLKDQAACPFRAFANWRLGAAPLEAPQPGPDPSARGQLVHAFMAALWRDLRTSAALAADVANAIDAAAHRAVRAVGLEGRFAELEVARLHKLAGEWLAIERQRKPFEVVHVEDARTLVIGGLTLHGRIDRMDRLADGSCAIIDYKTGSRVTPNDWWGERPDDPQLPLYAVTVVEPVSAIAYARVRAGGMEFFGYSAGGGVIPGVNTAKNWDTLVVGWKAALERLAGEFADGHAPVDPKRGLKTCRYCKLHTLCRVHERLSTLADDEEDEAQ